MTIYTQVYPHITTGWHGITVSWWWGPLLWRDIELLSRASHAIITPLYRLGNRGSERLWLGRGHRAGQREQDRATTCACQSTPALLHAACAADAPRVQRSGPWWLGRRGRSGNLSAAPAPTRGPVTLGPCLTSPWNTLLHTHSGKMGK